jgi:hypothetical protein
LACQASLINVQVRRQFLTPRQRLVVTLTLALVLYQLALATVLEVLNSHQISYNFWLTYGIAVAGWFAVTAWIAMRKSMGW